MECQKQPQRYPNNQLGMSIRTQQLEEERDQVRLAKVEAEVAEAGEPLGDVEDAIHPIPPFKSYVCYS